MCFFFRCSYQKEHKRCTLFAWCSHLTRLIMKTAKEIPHTHNLPSTVYSVTTTETTEREWKNNQWLDYQMCRWRWFCTLQIVSGSGTGKKSMLSPAGILLMSLFECNENYVQSLRALLIILKSQTKKTTPAISYIER